MQFITTDQRIAVENFQIGLIYTVTFTGGRYFSGACIGKGADFVMFQRTAPELVYCLNMAAAEDVESIEQTGGGGGTLNYNDLYNKPQINNVELAGNKSSLDLGLAALSDLTPLQAELVELVDGGAKNILPCNETTRTISNVTFTINSDNSISLSGTASANITTFNMVVSATAPNSGMWVLSGCPSGGAYNKYKLDLLDGGTSGSIVVNNYEDGTVFNASVFTSGMYTARIRIQSGTNCNGLVFRPMICSAAAWAISQTYKPYTPTLYELYQMIQG